MGEPNTEQQHIVDTVRLMLTGLRERLADLPYAPLDPLEVWNGANRDRLYARRTHLPSSASFIECEFLIHVQPEGKLSWQRMVFAEDLINDPVYDDIVGQDAYAGLVSLRRRRIA